MPGSTPPLGAPEAPRLEKADIGSRLDEIFAKDRTSRLVALFGRGDIDIVDVGAHRFRVVPTENELQLRRALPPLEIEPRSPESSIVFLVPWSRDLPADIQGRFVNGRVLDVSKQHRLKRLFGARELDDSVTTSALAEYVLRWSPQLPASNSGRLTPEGMWLAWLSAECGLTGGLSLDALLAWAASDARGPAFRARLAETQGQKVRAELDAFLGTRLGDAGKLVFAAWEGSIGRHALALALVFEALANDTSEAASTWVELKLHELRASAGQSTHEGDLAIARALGEACAPTLRMLERREVKGFGRSLLDDADALVTSPGVRKRLISSNRLPSAWQARLDELGTALARLAAAPSLVALVEGREARDALWKHEFAKAPDHSALLERAEMALRLGAWLVARTDRELERPQNSYGDVERLARWYADEGGFVDHARHAARGPDTDLFGQGARDVVAAVDRERRLLDLAFTRALPAWLDAGRPSERVVPIDSAFERLGARFLKEDESRRLLVLLLDGMGWAQAVELLGSLAESAHWGPISWLHLGKNRVGDGFYPPVLAALPTVTEVSRAAFFSGVPATEGKLAPTSKDPDRWIANRATRPFVGPKGARLLLKAEATTGSGDASTDALALVRDKGERLVALVLNAVDASLKGDSQHRIRWSLDAIRPLRSLLDAAREAGRCVLLASDHGHVPADLLETSGSYEGSSARYRPWNSGSEPLREFEIGLDAGTTGVWSPQGKRGIVLLADDAHRYGGSAHAGEHGGATLAEVIAPCLLISAEQAGFDDDKALALRAPLTPPWWFFDAFERRPETAKARGSNPPKPKTKVNEAQLPLLPSTPAKPQTPGPQAPPAAKTSALASSELFKQRTPDTKLRDQALQLVRFLLARDNFALNAAVAAELQVLPHRALQLATKLTEVFNIDGYQILRINFATGEWRLDRAQLEQVFEVTL
jgi:hypothetical protein